MRRLRSETRLRAQCGASSFSTWKRNQKTLGDAAGANFVRHAGLPPDPHYGGYPLGRAEHFRRAKSEWRSAIQSGPLGPECAKISIGAVPILRLPVPNQRSDSVFRRRGGCPHPPALQWSDLPVGAAHWAARVSLRPPLAALKVNCPVGAREGAGPWAPFCPGRKEPTPQIQSLR